MMRQLTTAAILVALSACTLPQGGAPRPEAVSLGGDQLTVRYPNGVNCHATVPLTGGSGRLQPCAWPASWQVTVARRNYLEPVLGGIVSPYATIIITDDAGRATSFRTPYSPNDDE